ncbi:MAG: hypothetical protein DMG06_16320 [Acidobacteria bacterium]|nr:MAG: hypothetical protein DMG06_16320 [Acidobacteriota bacterium]
MERLVSNYTSANSAFRAAHVAANGRFWISDCRLKLVREFMFRSSETLALGLTLKTWTLDFALWTSDTPWPCLSNELDVEFN